MEPESEKIIAEQVKKLPPEVRDALASGELHKKITAIGERHHLHIDQVGILEDEVVLVMMGMANPADFPGELVKQLSLQTTDAEAIAGDISQDIFLPIRDAMKKFTEKPEPSVVMPSAANAAAAPVVPKVAPASVPLAATPPKPVTPAPVPAAAVPTPPKTPPVPTPTPVPTAIKMVDTHAADLMLSQPTISVPPKPAAPPAPAAPVAPSSSSAPAASSPAPAAKTEAPKPVAPYKADPYREPPE